MKCRIPNSVRHQLLNIPTRLLSYLPFWALYAISDLLYYVVHYVARYRLTVVRENIHSCFADRGEKACRKIECDFYHFFCDYIVETIKLRTISPIEMRRHIRFEGLEEVENQLKTHPFAFVFLGHYGNWEWISSLPLFVGKDTHCAQLYRPLSDEAFDHLFMKLRTRFDSENISKYEALRRIVNLRREGTKTVIGFISDQSPRPQSIHDWTDFLNHKTPIFTGAERIAKKMDAAVFYCNVVQKERGKYVCQMQLMNDNVTSVPDFKLTEEYMSRLEETIRNNPHLWLWSHKRWKHEHLYAEMAKNTKV